MTLAHVLPCNVEMMLFLWALATAGAFIPTLRDFVARFRK